MPLTTVMKIGDTTKYITTDVADTKLMQFWLGNSATSGDNRGCYLKFKLSGAGGGGESLRSVTDVVNVAAGTAHGAHLSLSFATSGRITGLGAAVRGTLQVPGTSTSFGGSVYGMYAEIFHDGSGSTLANTTNHACLALANTGNATGVATHKYWLALIGANSTNVHTGTASGTAKLVAITIDNVEYWVLAYPSHT
jgi:hypothetical protein